MQFFKEYEKQENKNVIFCGTDLLRNVTSYEDLGSVSVNPAISGSVIFDFWVFGPHIILSFTPEQAQEIGQALIDSAKWQTERNMKND